MLLSRSFAARTGSRVSARACCAPLVRRLCRSADPEATIAPGGSDTPLALQRRFAALDGLQMKYDTMEKVYEQRLRDMEMEFHNATEHVFDRRSAIVSGASEPTTDEVTSSSFETAHLVDAEVPTSGVPEGVPGFWATAIKQCLNSDLATEDGEEDDLPLEQRFSEKDWEVLDYLVDVRTTLWVPPAPRWDDVMTEEDAQAQGLTPEQLEQMDADADADGDDERESGFALSFRFAQGNPFFDAELEELVIHCYSHGEVAHVTPEVLPWRAGMDPTFETKVKRKRRKGSSVSQRISEEVPRQSFFRLFTPLEALEEQEDEELAASVAKMQQEMPLMLRENLVPYASALYIQALLEEGGDGFDDDDALDESDLRGNNFRR